MISQRDRFMDSPMMVDPNLILDYGSSCKGTDRVGTTVVPANRDLWPSSDELSYGLDTDWINWSDSQLEDLIYSSSLCDDLNSLSFAGLGDLDCPFAAIGDSSQHHTDTHQLEPTSLFEPPTESDSIYYNVANFEEVYADHQSDLSCTSSEHDQLSDHESTQSFVTQSSFSSSTKRKASDLKNQTAKKRRRAKRVLDERVKNQNKVAALKYRKKKREEKTEMEQLLKIEEDKNKQLNGQIDELRVQIDIIKELMGKHLSKAQMSNLILSPIAST